MNIPFRIAAILKREFTQEYLNAAFGFCRFGKMTEPVKKLSEIGFYCCDEQKKGLK